MKKTIHSMMTVLAVALALAGCSSVPLDDSSKVPVETRNTSGVPGSSANAGGAGQSKVTPVDLAGAGQNTGMGKIVYFDFDSYVLKDEYRPLVEGYAKALTADRKKHVVVEGHTDERGGREYNLALGQKRAETVTKALALLGAADAQIEAVSYGKERPAAQGSDEAAWAKNRRAELNYR
jgi:peptidoglycan-associated lipoprotein